MQAITQIFTETSKKKKKPRPTSMWTKLLSVLIMQETLQEEVEKAGSAAVCN